MKIIEREISQAQVDALVQNGVAPLLARLFVGRGVQSPQELDTGLQHLLPPQPPRRQQQLPRLRPPCPTRATPPG